MHWCDIRRTLILLLLLTGLGSQSQPLEAASGPAVVTLLPGDAPDEKALAAVRRILGETPTFVPASGVSSYLRWALPDDRSTGCAEQRSQALDAALKARKDPPAAPTSDALTAVLELAQEHILYAEFKRVDRTLAGARALLPCLEAPVDPALLRAIFLYDAVTHVYLKDGKHGDPFLQMMAIDPRLYLEPDYPPRVQDAFLTTARTLMKVPMRRIVAEGLPGELYLDGLPFESGSEVRSGTHLLQLKGPSGRFYSALVQIPAGQDPFLADSVAELQPPRSEDRDAVLLERVRNRQWSAEEEPVIRGVLETLPQNALLFAILEKDEVSVRAYTKSQGWLSTRAELRPLAAALAGSLPTAGSESGRSEEGFGEESTPERLPWAIQMHLGGGASLATPTQPLSLLGELVFLRNLAPTLEVGAFAQLSQEGGTTGVSYPGLVGGVLLQFNVRVTSALGFRPTAGYGLGRGPALELGCAVPEDSPAGALSCTELTGVASTDARVLAPTFAHGPVTRLDVLYRLRQGRTRLALIASLHGQYLLLSLPTGGTLASDDGSTASYVVADALKPGGSFKLLGLLGLEVAF